MRIFDNYEKLMEEVENNDQYQREKRYWLRRMKKEWELNSFEKDVVRARVAEYYLMAYADYTPYGDGDVFQIPKIARDTTAKYFSVLDSPFYRKVIDRMFDVCEKEDAARAILYKGIRVIDGVMAYNID